MASKNTICLWYDGDALDAARFYAETFPDSNVGAVHRAPGDYPSGKQGAVLTVEFTVIGIPCIGLTMAGPRSSIPRRSRSRSPPTIRRKPIACGTPSCKTAARRASAVGVETGGASLGR